MPEWVSAVSASVAALAAVVVIFVTIIFSRKQVRVSQEQVRVSQKQTDLVLEAQYDQHRPLLFPTGNPDKVVLHNGGSGIALNIRGVFFSREPSNSKDPVVKYLHWVDAPLEPGTSITPENKQQVTIDGSCKIGKQTLYAPKAPTLEEISSGITPIQMRLTITYHDIFGRKHASTFDYTHLQKWVCVELQSNIPQDIEDLDRLARSETTQ